MRHSFIDTKWLCIEPSKDFKLINSLRFKVTGVNKKTELRSF